MNRTVLILAAALLLAALGAGAYTVGSQRPTLAPVPSVAPAAPDSSAGSVTAYVRARDAVCDAGMAARAPLETRYTRIWTTGVTDAEFADGVAALRDFVTLDRGVESDLLALDVPPELLRDHVAFVTRLDDVILMITNELSLIDAGNLAGAQAVDLATDPMSQKMNAFETRNGLRPCP